MNVTVIAPHPDDEAIGCGGAICLHALRGDRVAVAFLTSGECGLKHLEPEDARQIREREAEAAAEVLGVDDLTFLRGPDWMLGNDEAAAAALLGPVLAREAPAIVYLPHPRDGHPDHRATLGIVQAALRHARSQPPVVLAYEVWTPLVEFDHVQDITPVIARKLRALRCHRSQIACYRYDRAARGLALYRGAIAGKCGYAEVFQSVASTGPEV